MNDRVSLAPYPLYEKGFPLFPMVPCSLADRPNHLRALRNLGLYLAPDAPPLGLMVHANITSNMQALGFYTCAYTSSFRLVGVAQRTTVEEYLACYGALKTLGALGALHPGHIPQLVHLRVWADGKWWLFQQAGAQPPVEKGNRPIQMSLPDTIDLPLVRRQLRMAREKAGFTPPRAAALRAATLAELVGLMRVQEQTRLLLHQEDQAPLRGWLIVTPVVVQDTTASQSALDDEKR